MRPGRLLVALVAALTTCLAASQVALAKPGDLIVTSYSPGDVVRIHPASGHQSLISASPKFEDPQGLTFSPSGKIFVADYGTGDAIFRVDPKSGKATVRSADPAFQDPQYVDMGPDGRLYVPDDSDVAVFRILPGSASADPFSSGGQYVYPYGVEVDHDGSILVADASGKLFRVNRVTGAKRLLADTTSQDPDLAGITEAPNGIVYASTSDPKILRINPKTGAVSTVSSGGLMNSVYDVAIAPNGMLYATNYNFTPGAPEVLKVNPKTGHQSVVARNEKKLHAAAGIEIQPPKCGGELAQIVGSNEHDRLTASKFPDVIAGLGGGDTIKGKGGDDLLCGGGGNDKVVDTKGRNVIDCGPGHDTVVTNPKSKVARNCEDVTRR